jgi:putative acetyltransferase
MIAVTRVTTPDDGARALIGELDAELAVLTPDCGQRHGLELDAIFQPHVRFFVAHDSGEAVGCGGVALFADFAEVKRMYVRGRWRGRGVADAIMDRLIAEAVAVNIPCLRLETGDNFAPATRFYRRRGFAPCAIFGAYAAMPAHAVAASAFLERRLP